MLDLKFIRENLEVVTSNCQRRGCKVSVDEVVVLDDKRLSLIQKIEDLRAERNRIAKSGEANRELGSEIKLKLKELEPQLAEVEKELHEKMSWLPNMLAEDVPSGKSDEDNAEIRKWGEIPKFNFKIRDHQELGELLDVIDTERATKVAAAKFYYLKNEGALLAWGLFWWVTKYLVSQGFTPFFTPDVAKERTLYGTGYLPFFAEDIYKLEGQDLSLIGTSEQTLVAYHTDEVLALKDLPKLYTAFSPCFRTEAGAYGKDTRGIFRVHQFHKVEQIILCLPEESAKWHEACQKNEEYFFQALEIPYRVVKVCDGDLGAPGYKKYDIEAWFPGQDRYREVTSNTNLTDFQTRRLNIRVKTKDGQTIFPHTISATAVTDRAIIAILENNQQADGSVAVPKVLQEYVGVKVIRPKG